MPVRTESRVWASAFLLFLAALAIWWPGVATYDSVQQYHQVLTGTYDDWHPPAMARLWALLHPLGNGTAPMFVLQFLLYWMGFGLLAAVLARSGRPRVAAVMLGIGAFPLFAGWQACVLKDVQMLGAMLAAVGLLGWWRLAERRVPPLAVAAIVILLAYATLVRANAFVATMPLAAMLWPGSPRLWKRAAGALLGAVVVLAVTPVINHRLLHAEETTVSHTLQIFDVVGITHFADANDVLLPHERIQIDARHCYTPFFWDPLGDNRHCGDVAARLNDIPGTMLDKLWLGAIRGHPRGYVMHRLAHLNATDRLFVPAGLMSAAPPSRSEPNDLGLGAPGAAAGWIAQACRWLVETPLGWPAAWIVVAGTGLWIGARRARGAARDLALALLVSALCLEASFAVVSIASDLRYHLWPMVATALACALLVPGRGQVRIPLIIGSILLALVIVIGGTARIILPYAPQGYQAMLG